MSESVARLSPGCGSYPDRRCCKAAELITRAPSMQPPSRPYVRVVPAVLPRRDGGDAAGREPRDEARRSARPRVGVGAEGGRARPLAAKSPRPSGPGSDGPNMARQCSPPRRSGTHHAGAVLGSLNGAAHLPSGPCGSLSMKSEKPRMAFSGVRSSWLIWARKSLFI